MLWFVLVIPAFCFIVKDVWTGIMKPDGFIDCMISVFFTILFTGIIAGVCAGCAALTGLLFASHPVQVSDKLLIAIRDKDGVTGEFFLGSGVIKSDQYYFYYERMENGGFRPGRIISDSSVHVYEDARSDAKLIEFEWVVDNPLASLIAFPVNAGGYSYEFHVPKGTIRTVYSM
jgi:hypothetical protein